MELVTSTNIYFERRHELFIPMRECIVQCARAGYHKLDFGFAELVLYSKRFAGDAWKEEIYEYKELAEQNGIQFVQAHATILDFCNPDEIYEQKEQLFRRSIEAAGMLGAPWIVVHPSTGVQDGRIDPDTHQKNVEFFRKYSAFARRHGVGLAIENMWGKTRNGIPHYAVQPVELLRLVVDVGCDNIKVCWDAEHGSVENLDQKAAIRMLGNHIVATHISDETGADNIHILPYFGRADWEEILEALADIGYSGTFDFEIQHFLPGVPSELVPSAMKFSHEVGSYLVKRLIQMKKERGYA